MAKKRDIKYAGDRDAEKIEEVVTKFNRATPLRISALWPESRAEILSAIPIAPPIGYVKQPSLAERIRAMVRSEHLRAAAEGSGFESFDEAEDFDTGEDYDPRSPYELDESDGVSVAPPPVATESPKDAPKGDPGTPPPAASSEGPLPTPQSGGKGSEGK